MEVAKLLTSLPSWIGTILQQINRIENIHKKEPLPGLPQFSDSLFIKDSFKLSNTCLHLHLTTPSQHQPRSRLQSTVAGTGTLTRSAVR